MRNSLSVSDFKITLAVCELRYADTYLIYDQTGRICNELGKVFTNFKVENPTPSSTTMRSDEGSFALETAQCRFTSQKTDPKLEVFAGHSKSFFDSVLYNLDIRAFTRIGLRTFHRKDFESLDDAKNTLASLGLVNLKPIERFGAASEPKELALRWEGSQVGALFRLSAETGKIDVVFPPEISEEAHDVHKSITGLRLDVDYYTVAPVERSQWDASAWITNSMRMIRKQVDSIFGE